MRTRRIPGALAAGAAAIGIAACGSSANTQSVTAAKTTPANPAHTSQSAAASSTAGLEIERAAAVSGAAKGEKLSYTTTEELPSLGELTLSGTGVFNNAPQTGDMQLTVDIPGLAELSSAAEGFTDLPLSLVSSGSAFYIKLPSSLTGLLQIAAGKPWLAVDLHDLSSIAHIPELSDLLNSQSGPTDPAGYLKQIEAASASGVKKVGTATVNGVQTTEYQADLNFAKLNGDLPAALRSALKSELAKAAAVLGTSIPIRIWIDSDNLVRRFELSANVNADGDSIPVTVTENILAYGPQPKPVLPPASQTFSLSSLITLLDNSGLSSLAG